MYACDAADRSILRTDVLPARLIFLLNRDYTYADNLPLTLHLFKHSHFGLRLATSIVIHLLGEACIGSVAKHFYVMPCSVDFSRGGFRSPEVGSNPVLDRLPS